MPIATDIHAPLKIRSVEFSPRLILAPMSGVTCSAFRRMIRRENPGAVGLLVTEFISIEGLTRANPQSVRLMQYREEERPLSIQIFGYDIDRMVDAAKIAQDAGADIVDINCGCPVPKVVKRGGGCELMRQPDHLMKILAAVRNAVTIPLTLKIRAGWDDNSRNALDVAVRAEQCGIDMLTIHGRTRVQLYRGLADWNLIGEVASNLSIPVVGSGDIMDVESARERLASGAAALMIGRGALANPWIFSELSALLSGKSYAPHRPEETARLLRRYALLLHEDMPEKGAIGRLKQLASQAVRNMPGAAQARKAMCTSQTVSALLDVTKRWEDDLSSGRLELNPVDSFQDVQGSPLPEIQA
jgi:tRNA-dihydrouridine synthase B